MREQKTVFWACSRRGCVELDSSTTLGEGRRDTSGESVVSESERGRGGWGAKQNKVEERTWPQRESMHWIQI